MKLYVLRHGMTDVNRAGGRFQGQIEIELNEDGIRQAKIAGEQFRQRGIHFDRVIASPLHRAFDTAALASGFSSSRITTDPRLLEQNFGPFEGKRWEEMNPRTFKALMEDAANYVPVPGAESILHLIQRTSDFFDELTREAPDESILIGTHGGNVRALLVHLHLADLQKFWQTPVGNCAWYEFTLTDHGLEVTDREVGEEI